MASMILGFVGSICIVVRSPVVGSCPWYRQVRIRFECRFTRRVFTPFRSAPESPWSPLQTRANHRSRGPTRNRPKRRWSFGAVWFSTRGDLRVIRRRCAIIKTVRVGFEPTVTRRPRQFSRLVRSTAPPPHLGDSGPFRPERHGTAVPRNSCSLVVASPDGDGDSESSADGQTWGERPATRPATRGDRSFRARHRAEYAGEDADAQACEQRDDRWPPGGGGKTAGDHDAGEGAEAAGRRRGALTIAE